MPNPHNQKKPLRPAGRTLAEFQPLKPGETKLLEACRTGDDATLDEKRPEQATESNTVRAGFVRFLALGGDESAPIHEHGVFLRGAWIEGVLDLRGAGVPSDLRLINCIFSFPLQLISAHIRGSLALSGSQIPGLTADGLVCDGDVFLKEGFSATGKVRLLGAQIGGNLECNGAKLNGKDGVALVADRAVIKGSVFLNKDFKDFSATGMVSLLGAQIGGDLVCDGAKLDGKDGNALAADGAVIEGCVFLNKGFSATGMVRLLGAQIGGNLACDGAKLDGKDGVALVADGMVVTGSFFFRDLKPPVHGVSLSHAQVGQLIDDKNSWGGQLVLDGFVYGSIAGGAPTDAATRLKWLDKQSEQQRGASRSHNAEFCPQPWRQLQNVLREMGHVEDARQVAITFEDRLRGAGLIGQTSAHWWSYRAWFVRPVKNGFHYLFGKLIGYGYRPLLLVRWMLGVWLVCGMFFWYAALQGVFAPSNPLVFQHPDYAACVSGSSVAKAELAKPAYAKPPPVQGAGNWYLCDKLPEEYTGFSPLAYSLDVILPLVDLHQEHDWSTLISTPHANWYEELMRLDLNRFTRFVIWLEILFGWVASLLLVAVVSGLTKRRED